MNVKKLTIMILDEANKGTRGVFDASGACVQGDESVRSVALEVLGGAKATSPAPAAAHRPGAPPAAPMPTAAPTPAAAPTPPEAPQGDGPLMPEPLSSTDVSSK